MNVRGFSLVELVVIITIISLLAIFATARFGGGGSLAARGYHDELVSATRFAQRYAIASGCSVQLNVSSNSYSLNLLNSGPGCAAAPVQRPDGGTFAGNAPGGVSASGATGNYVFNALGDVDTGGSITVAGGGTTLSFAISSGSGFVASD